MACRFEEAKARLKRAIEQDKQFQKLGIDDKDLRPFWDWNAELRRLHERHDSNELLFVCAQLSPVSSQCHLNCSGNRGAKPDFLPKDDSRHGSCTRNA